MFDFAPYVLLQCLGASLAWAVITRRGTTGPALVEAGGAWVAPLAAAGVNGVSADMVAGVASCGVAFNIAAWVLLGALRSSDGPGGGAPR